MGVAVVDIEKPEQPRLDQWIDGGGAIDDAHDVKIGFTNGSGFAYVADGRNGLRVVQIISANDTPGAYGFSPRPTPKLVATYATHGPALALPRGLDRDRAVDKTGNQRAPARPQAVMYPRRPPRRAGAVRLGIDLPHGAASGFWRPRSRPGSEDPPRWSR
jgi:hypothetical protein